LHCFRVNTFMTGYKQEVQSFTFQGIDIKLCMPQLTEIRGQTGNLQANKKETHFPYWAKLWPSAIAMCQFITANRKLVANKTVLELAAGLGLPGLLVAHLAKEVTISDYAPEAVTIMQTSVVLNELTNINCRELNWYALPPDLATDVLLLSDINYDPSAFEVLYKVLLGFLNKGTTIVLTTPQRLMAKPFIEWLLPYCIQKEELEITHRQEVAFISILVLCKKQSV
jgi:predicted nicotinamide N-methyase